ncbi:MAG: hypothetical protein ACO3NN_09420 [Candidatus Puniceispirillales bacterium]|jgi:hypothetical protein
MKNRPALKLTDEDLRFLRNKEGISKLEKKSLNPNFDNKNKANKSKKK